MAALGAAALVAVMSMTQVPAGTGEGGFVQRSITIGSESYRYQVWVPPGWDPGQRLPVVLFLHGSGERGDDAWQQTKEGLGPALRRNPERFPCIVVFPQCRKGRWWPEPDMESLAMQALERTIEEFNGDRTRLLLTGKSMGGSGVWHLAAENPGLFAAAAPVCGFLYFHEAPPPRGKRRAKGDSVDRYEETARLMDGTPVWLFHGDDDRAVSVEESRRMRNALVAAGGKVRYTEYPGAGHSIWDRVYADPEFVSWLLSQRLPE